MNAKPLSQSEFDRLKAEALRAEPVAKKVMLNRIELTDNSYADGVVKIDGRGVSADTSFFKGLSKILNISKGMQDDLTGESGGPSSLYPKMVEAMKNLRGGGRTVTIVGDPVSGGLMGVYDKDPGRIPNADLFRVTEGLLNRYPGLSPVEINVKDGGMGVGISLLSSADIGFGNHGGPDGGDWQGGGEAGMAGCVVDMSASPNVLLQDDQSITLGTYTFKVLPTPGHTRGHVTYYDAEEAVAFCGDLIFRYSIGRTDLNGGDFFALMNSIRTHILTMPPDTILYSGHGKNSTIREQIQSNPFLTLQNPQPGSHE